MCPLSHYLLLYFVLSCYINFILCIIVCFCIYLLSEFTISFALTDFFLILHLSPSYFSVVFITCPIVYFCIYPLTYSSLYYPLYYCTFVFIPCPISTPPWLTEMEPSLPYTETVTENMLPIQLRPNLIGTTASAFFFHLLSYR